MMPSKTLTEMKLDLFQTDPDARRVWIDTAARRALSRMLVETRIRHKLSQSDLTSLTGWDRDDISRLESATEGFPSVETLARYLAACGENLALASYREDSAGSIQLTDWISVVDVEANEPMATNVGLMARD